MPITGASMCFGDVGGKNTNADPSMRVETRNAAGYFRSNAAVSRFRGGSHVPSRLGVRVWDGNVPMRMQP
jgi:hypothetical protein